MKTEIRLFLEQTVLTILNNMPGLTLQDAQKRGFKPGNSPAKTQPMQQSQENPLVGFGKGVLKGAASTIQGMETIGQKTVGALGTKIAEKITGNKIENKPITLPRSLTEASNQSQKIGKGVEQIAEWFIPSGWFGKAAKGIEAGIEATKLAKSGGLLPKISTGATKVAARSAVSGSEGAVVSGVQSGGNLDEMKSNAEFGAAIPIVGKGLSILGKGVSKTASGVRSVATGVKSDVFQRLKESPQAYDDAMKHLAENGDTPFLGLSNSIASKLNALKETAKTSYDTAKKTILDSFPDTTFDLEHKIPALSKALEPFNLVVKQVKDKSGRFLQDAFVSPTTRTSPYTQSDLLKITDIVRKMRVKNMSINELTDFQESVKTFLGDAVKRDDKKMIKLGYSLLGSSIKFVNEVAPQLKEANTLYENYYKALASGGNKIIDQATGEIKAGAETFLSNLSNLNKGNQKNALRYVEDATGIPIADNVTVLKDAMKLNNLFPATGSRTQDILRSFATAGIGTAAGGLGIGAAAGLALSSPKVQAKLAIKLSELVKKFPSLPPEVKKIFQYLSGGKISGDLSSGEKSIANKVTSTLDNPKAGMSVQDVSGGKAGYSNPLFQEAGSGKYANAEEFVKAQGEPVYHGTQAKFDKFDSKFATDAEGRKLNLGWGKGNFYFTTKKGEALKYATRERSPEVAKLYLKGEPNVVEAFVDIKNPFDMGSAKNAERWRKVRDGYWSDGVSDFNYHKIPKGKTKAEAFVEQLKKEGYDGIIDGQEITAFSESSIKTKSQLIDIYNKAQGGTKRGFGTGAGRTAGASKATLKEEVSKTLDNYLSNLEPSVEGGVMNFKESTALNDINSLKKDLSKAKTIESIKSIQQEAKTIVDKVLKGRSDKLAPVIRNETKMNIAIEKAKKFKFFDEFSKAYPNTPNETLKKIFLASRK